MGEEKRKDLYIEFYDADAGKMEWRKFEPSEVDSLMELGILDTDTLGYYMQDKEAFEKAMSEISCVSGPMSYGQLVAVYLTHSDSDLMIKA